MVPQKHETLLAMPTEKIARSILSVERGTDVLDDVDQIVCRYNVSHSLSLQERSK